MLKYQVHQKRNRFFNEHPESIAWLKQKPKSISEGKDLEAQTFKLVKT